MMRRAAMSAAATAALLIAAATAAAAQVGSAPPGTSMGVPGTNNSNARPEEMGEHDSLAVPSPADQLRLSAQAATAARAVEEARSQTGRAVPAKPADILVQAPVNDSAGQPIGTIEAVDADGAVVVTLAGKVKVPLNAFGKNKKGLLIGMTRKDFEALVAKANASPAG
jgi:Spy/CpxP family protein refolding chaperone